MMKHWEKPRAWKIVSGNTQQFTQEIVNCTGRPPISFTAKDGRGDECVLNHPSE